MGRYVLDQLSVYLTSDLAAAVRASARARASSVSDYLKTLIQNDIERASNAVERHDRGINYLTTSVDAIMDEIMHLRAPPPVRYRGPDDKPLRQQVREIHDRRYGSTSDAD